MFLNAGNFLARGMKESLPLYIGEQEEQMYCMRVNSI